MKKRNAMQTLATNLALTFLLGSVAAVCLFPIGSEAVSGKVDVYRYGNESTGGVSLMFNVYWGEGEVLEILDVLDEYKAKSTFFIGGCWADDHVECLKEIAARGHEIGNHGYFHKAHDQISVEANKEEILRCNQFIQLAIGQTPTLFAPPSGAYNDATLSACQTLRMKTVLWSKDTIDWRDKDETLIYARATKDVKAGALVLMHPTEATVKALPKILNEYKSRSLCAITVGENLQLGG